MTRVEKIAMAENLGLDFNKNISNVNLDTMLTEAGIDVTSVSDDTEDQEVAVQAKLAEIEKNKVGTPVTVQELSAGQKKAAMRKENLKLVRCIVAPMDQTKTEYDGEIFSASNSVSGTIKKFVKFNVEWHVPQIILSSIQESKMVRSKSRKVNGQTIKEVAEVPAYSVQILPTLTQEELDRLKDESKSLNK